MIIVLYFFTIAIFFFSLTMIFSLLIIRKNPLPSTPNPPLKNDPSPHPFKVLGDGFKEGLKGCGFLFKESYYTVELYKWVPRHDKHVCQECLLRASWPAMDIADWMKHGLPGTPEAGTHCNKHCRCRLILYRVVPKKKVQSHDS